MEQNERAIGLEAAREAAIRKEAEERAREAAIQARFAAQAAAELAEAEARNLWDAEAAAGPPGSVAGGGMEEESVSIGTRIKAITDAGGCPSTHDPCYPKGGKGGSANEGGTGSCRSGGKHNKKGECQTGKGYPGTDCSLVGGAVGGAAGGALGGWGALVGGAAGSAAGGALCGEGSS